MKDVEKLDEYDRLRLMDAWQSVYKVYAYNYGEWRVRGQVKKLETILKKIDALTGEEHEY